MSFQPVPDCASAQVFMGTSGTTNWGPTVNVLNFKHDGIYILDNLAELAQAIADWWAASVMPVLSADVQLNGVTTRGLANDPDYEAAALTGLPQAGSIGSNVLPSNVAACMSFSSGRIGRSTRGRIYIAGLADTAANDDDITETVRGLLLDAFQIDLPAALPTDWSWVIVSRFHDNVKRDTGVVYPIQSVSFKSNQVATQQRRLHRFG